MIQGFFSDQCKLIKIQDHTTAGTSTVTSSAVDMLQTDGFYQNVLLFTSFGTAASNNTIKAQQSSDDGSSDAYADLEGTSVASGSSDEDTWIDLKPRERYVKFLALRGTSSTLESMWALLYNPRNIVETNVVSGTIIGEAHNRPAEGTA